MATVGFRLGVNVGPSGVETPHIGLEGRWIGEQFLYSGAVGGVVEEAGFQRLYSRQNRKIGSKPFCHFNFIFQSSGLMAQNFSASSLVTSCR